MNQRPEMFLRSLDMRSSSSNLFAVLRRLSYYLFGIAAGLMILGLFKQLRNSEQAHRHEPPVAASETTNNSK